MELEERTCPICGQKIKLVPKHWKEFHRDVDFNDYMAQVEGIERPICEHCGRLKVWIQKNKWRCTDEQCMKERNPNKYRPEKRCLVCGLTYKRIRDHWRQYQSEEFLEFDDFINFAYFGPDHERPTCPYCGSTMHWEFSHNHWQCDNPECRVKNHGRRTTDTMREKGLGWFRPGAAAEAPKKGVPVAMARGVGIHDKERAEREKWGLRNPETHRKTINSQRENQTGRFNPDFYKNHKDAIDAALARGRKTQKENKLGIWDPIVRYKSSRCKYGEKETSYFYLALLEDIETGIYYTKPGYTGNLWGRLSSYERPYNGFKIKEVYALEGPTSETLLIEQMVHSKFRDYSEDPNQGRSSEWRWLDGQREYKRECTFRLIKEYVSSNFGKEMRKMEIEVS